MAVGLTSDLWAKCYISPLKSCQIFLPSSVYPVTQSCSWLVMPDTSLTISLTLSGYWLLHINYPVWWRAKAGGQSPLCPESAYVHLLHDLQQYSTALLLHNPSIFGGGYQNSKICIRLQKDIAKKLLMLAGFLKYDTLHYLTYIMVCSGRAEAPEECVSTSHLPGAVMLLTLSSGLEKQPALSFLWVGRRQGDLNWFVYQVLVSAYFINEQKDKKWLVCVWIHKEEEEKKSDDSILNTNLSCGMCNLQPQLKPIQSGCVT